MDNFDVLKAADEHRGLRLVQTLVDTDAQLQTRIAATRENLALIGKVEGVLLTGADLDDVYAIEGGNFERSVSFAAFHGIEAALAREVVTTADDVALARQEQRVRATAADLNDFFFQDIEGLLSDGETDVTHISRIAQLAVRIVTPAVDLRLGRECRVLLRSWQTFSANDHREVVSA